MRMTLLTFSALVGAASAFSTPVRADVIDLGEQFAPASLSFENSGLSGPFSDTVQFSIGTGDTFLVSSFLTTGYSNRFFIPDLQASLFQGSTLVETGIGTAYAIPFPDNDVSFAPILLGAGSYQLDISGTATSAFPGPTSSYEGTLTVAAATAVPEPSAALLLASGLAVFAAVSVRSRAGT